MQLSEAAQRYTEKVERYTEEQWRLSRRDLGFSRARGIVFLLAALLALLAWLQGEFWLGVAAGLALLGFLVLAIVHDAVERRLNDARNRCLVNERRLARLRRNWRILPDPEVVVPPPLRSLANDLDLTGTASVYQWLSLAGTSMGRETLLQWLLDPAEPEVIRDRQAKVQALADVDQWREDLEVHGQMLAGSRFGPEAFLEWAEAGVWQDQRPALRWLARLLPLALIGVLVLTLSRALPAAWGWPLAIGIVLLQSGLAVMYVGFIHDIFDRIATQQGEVWQYAGLLEIAARLPAEIADEQGEQIRHRAAEALPELQRLGRIMQLAALRRGGLLGIVYLVGSLLLLVDFQLLSLVENWQRRCGQRVRSWLQAVGQLEALASLANVARDQPDWCFPLVDSQADRVDAVQVGHPLLTDESRVANDVQVGPRGNFLLVTGSNMSGKSTLLRSLGVNIQLAQMGGPVCARSFRMPPLHVETSMRVHDSLEGGVSFFMAELKRLKQIVDASRQFREAGGRSLFFLLDEILQGTNSVERHLAVVRVIRHLVAQRAFGAVSTHDLQLADHPELAENSRVIHFRETIDNDEGHGKMTFDYRIRDGVSTTTNALRLLELVGLGE